MTVSEPAPSFASTTWVGCIGLAIGAGPKEIEDRGEQSTHTAHKEKGDLFSPEHRFPATSNGDPFPVKRQAKVSIRNITFWWILAHAMGLVWEQWTYAGRDD